MPRIALFVIAGALLVTAMQPAGATLVTLQDGNSVVNFNTGTNAGMQDWIIDGVDQLFQQWFWIRHGSTSPEIPLNNLTETGLLASDTNPFSDPNLDTLAGLWTGTNYTVEVAWVLRGGNAGSGVSDVTEAITITNTGDFALQLAFFQYSDFDLGGVTGGQTVNINAGHQIANQSGGGLTLTETIVTPPANFAEANVHPNTLNSLNDASPTTLNNVLAAFGDATWAFQWNFVLNPGDTFQISKDKQIRVIPAPGAVLLGAMGLALVQRLRRRIPA